MFLRLVEATLGLGLLVHGLFEISANPTWWAYEPVYLVSAVLAIIQLPRNSAWRTLSSLSILVGGLYTSFLLWTFSSIETTSTTDLKEAENIPPLAFGVFLISFIRLTNDKNTQPIHYIRTVIIFMLSLINFYGFITYFWSST